MDDFKQKLINAGFKGDLDDSAAAKEFYSHDASLFEIKPRLVVFPKDAREVDSITREVAHDIRHQYILVDKPDVAQSEGGYRVVKVEARAPGHRKLFVRTRTGYYAGNMAATNVGGK